MSRAASRPAAGAGRVLGDLAGAGLVTGGFTWLLNTLGPVVIPFAQEVIFSATTVALAAAGKWLRDKGINTPF